VRANPDFNVASCFPKLGQLKMKDMGSVRSLIPIALQGRRINRSGEPWPTRGEHILQLRSSSEKICHPLPTLVQNLNLITQVNCIVFIIPDPSFRIVFSTLTGLSNRKRLNLHVIKSWAFNRNCNFSFYCPIEEINLVHSPVMIEIKG
jgi:hypothetical protein